jgi:hypothetical protein
MGANPSRTQTINLVIEIVNRETLTLGHPHWHCKEILWARTKVRGRLPSIVPAKPLQKKILIYLEHSQLLGQETL